MRTPITHPIIKYRPRFVKLGYFGINMGPHSRPDDLAETARIAESAGVESLWTGEHVVLPSPQLPAQPQSAPKK